MANNQKRPAAGGTAKRGVRVAFLAGKLVHSKLISTEFLAQRPVTEGGEI
jgi:hypothetical protein